MIWRISSYVLKQTKQNVRHKLILVIYNWIKDVYIFSHTGDFFLIYAYIIRGTWVAPDCLDGFKTHANAWASTLNGRSDTLLGVISFMTSFQCHRRVLMLYCQYDSPPARWPCPEGQRQVYTHLSGAQLTVKDKSSTWHMFTELDQRARVFWEDLEGRWDFSGDLRTESIKGKI